MENPPLVSCPAGWREEGFPPFKGWVSKGGGGSMSMATGSGEEKALLNLIIVVNKQKIRRGEQP